MPDNPSPPEHVVEAAIEEKKDHLDQVAAAPIAKATARQEAYQRIIDSTKTGMAEYYQRYPSRAIDDRSQDAEQWSLNGLRAIFRILDDYQIIFRSEVTNEHTADPKPAANSNPEHP